MVEIKSDAFKDYRQKAVIAVGERKIKFAKKAVSDIYWDKANWGHLKFHAAVSLFELDAKKALSQLQYYMPKYDDNVYKVERRQFVLGQTTFRLKRWSGSGYIEALDKFERTKDKRMLPLILEMLKPTKLTVAVAPDPKGKKKKKKKSKTTTKTRKKKGELDDGQPKGPEPIYRAKNQFVRARAVEIAALIGGEDAAEVLGKAVDDYRSVVRQAAIRAIGEISGRYTLHIGAKLEEECKVRPMALAWLNEKGVRKLAD
ncbi:MAG: HEAT repeat domain-containing protein [Planctomycetota bacterium]|nr:HEAT repeat domain-containing protein [Planctomycetota bacterium]